eukprot:CAMPEP_0204822724 /NCGR_PEP_ID=MMETSP1346-20131115/905_1 /ASSEMBLY_ACC=CAM_ASM_000771 /TAXON_ID=215587 /ORGANISM="Aplanochytrium stocchinoi, Strain GSBS06" /LENGTH=122 /DNA_ID=CAMNT_0051949079 /DNA_START=261 /DNA_END=626 /DNA_ORIENTATION=+
MVLFVKDLENHISLTKSQGGGKEAGLLLRKLAGKIPDASFVKSIIACNRIELITGHLLPHHNPGFSLEDLSGSVSDGSKTGRQIQVQSYAIIPLPGTFEYDQWLQVLRSRPDSVGVKVLLEW